MDSPLRGGGGTGLSTKEKRTFLMFFSFSLFFAGNNDPKTIYFAAVASKTDSDSAIRIFRGRRPLQRQTENLKKYK